MMHNYELRHGVRVHGLNDQRCHCHCTATVQCPAVGAIVQLVNAIASRAALLTLLVLCCGLLHSIIAADTVQGVAGAVV